MARPRDGGKSQRRGSWGAVLSQGARRGSDLPAALTRECPKCGAKPGFRCGRQVVGKVGGQDIGGGYWRPMAKIHSQRRLARPGGPLDPS